MSQAKLWQVIDAQIDLSRYLKDKSTAMAPEFSKDLLTGAIHKFYWKSILNEASEAERFAIKQKIAELEERVEQESRYHKLYEQCECLMVSTKLGLEAEEEETANIGTRKRKHWLDVLERNLTAALTSCERLKSQYISENGDEN